MPADDSLPVRTEITVLPADDPKARKIGFTVKEYSGCPIYPAPPGMTAEQIIAEGLPEGFELTWLTEPDALQDGDVILAPALMGGLHVGTVGTHEGQHYFATPGMTYLGFLSFGGDDRHCWVTLGGGNLRSIRRALKAPEGTGEGP